MATQVKIGDLIKHDIKMPLAKGGYHRMVVVGEVTFVNDFRAEYKTVEVLVDENNPGNSKLGQGGGFALPLSGNDVTRYEAA